MVRDPIFPVVKSSRGDKANPGEMSNHNTRRCETGGHVLRLDNPRGRGKSLQTRLRGPQAWGAFSSAELVGKVFQAGKGRGAAMNTHVQGTGPCVHSHEAGNAPGPSSALLNSVFLRPWEATGLLRQVTVWRAGHGAQGCQGLRAWAGEPSDNRKQLQQAPGR